MHQLAGYPKSLQLPDGGSVQVRQMSAADRDAALAFARALPEEDLRFLRVDLTEASVVDDWMRNLDSGHSTSLVAYDADGLVGYATVHRNPASWTRHLGELRINVSPAYRSRGLGRRLIASIFDVARDIGLQKLSGHMMADQSGAQAAFRRLGFVPEALLADYVIDRDGRTHDLVIMSHDITGHTDRADGVLRI